jgi:hypothetical protein
VTRIEGTKGDRLAVLGPLVLAADLLLLLGGEVVLDVESLTDLIGRLALDHVRDGLAADIEESLDVEVVGGLQIVSVYSLQNMNFWSHSSMSVDFLRESESSSWVAGGSSLWCSHHSITFFITASLTCAVLTI